MRVSVDLARRLLDSLAGIVEVADETHAFRYFDERDLLGFVDGTESPPDTATAAAVALLGAEPDRDDQQAYTGGSYLIVQKYLHDLSAWNDLTTEEQEAAIGRTKLDDVEFPDEKKPSNSHLALNTIHDADGHQLQIVRGNLAFGRVGSREFGTYFISYAADPRITEQMLRRMFLGEPPGNYDRILDFSTAVTGCLFFVPPAGLLEHPETYAETDRSSRPPDRTKDASVDTP